MNHDPLKTPLPNSPSRSADNISEAENKLIVKINSLNGKPNLKPATDELAPILEETEFPSLPPVIKNSGKDSKPPTSNYFESLEEMDTDTDDNTDFTKPPPSNISP